MKKTDQTQPSKLPMCLPRATSDAQAEDFDAAVSLAFHRLLAETQGVIHAVMDKRQMSQKDIAELLHVHPGTVSRYLEQDSNLTLKTVAKLITALRDRFEVSSCEFNKMIAHGSVEGFYKVESPVVLTWHIYTGSSKNHAIPKINYNPDPFFKIIENNGVNKINSDKAVA